ncbi:MAG: hypothetical protein HWN67_11830, partial [Candidatus Helarchaeota archaeon]|nr:hypothetical protein [Candidatus Helarchaeota archaeon]
MKTKKCVLFIVMVCITPILLLFINNTPFLPIQKYKIISSYNLIEKAPTSWIGNGIAICTASNTQRYPQICSNGSDGAIMVWEDTRNGNYDIYVQKISSNGTIHWDQDGVPICTDNDDQYDPRICSDGAGGAIITWRDWRGVSSDVYVQRIAANGTVMWTGNGTPICTEFNSQTAPEICSDGEGGAIIVWDDSRSATNWDIYAQRINSSGEIYWAVNGTPICTQGDPQFRNQICSDGVAGAIIVWEDGRGSNPYDIYAQKINSSGHSQWTADGTAISTAEDDQLVPKVLSDGEGGAIFTWHDRRSSVFDIYAQKINSSEVLLWDGNGTAICTVGGGQSSPRICSDGAGGAIIGWYDVRNGVFNADVYAQKINGSGNIEWDVNGIGICTSDEDQLNRQISSDGDGGAVLTWQDYRNNNDYNIYVQWISSPGVIQWDVNGEPICMATNDQEYPQICKDGNNSVIIVWQDFRNGNYDIFVQRVLLTPSSPTNNFLELLILILSIYLNIQVSNDLN